MPLGLLLHRNKLEIRPITPSLYCGGIQIHNYNDIIRMIKNYIFRTDYEKFDTKYEKTIIVLGIEHQ